MKKINVMMLSAASLMLMTACSSKLGALSADNFKVNPKPLETRGGHVEATVDGIFPEKYMHRKAVVKVTPELRYQTANGQQVERGASSTFQGEKVMGNDRVISYKLGGHYSMKPDFVYQPDMMQSELWMTFTARVGNKVVEIPAVKVANGVKATSELYRKTLVGTAPVLAADSFQRISQVKQEANIKFLVAQTQLRKSELQSRSVTDFLRLLTQINNERESMVLNNIEVSAYASPEGTFAVNNRLASGRQNVLSMYDDPEEREQQIRNMSEAFRELSEGILPELRRARLIANYEVVGRSDEQIRQQLKADPTQLNVEELLYAATLTSDLNEQLGIYQEAVKEYAADPRAYNNIGRIYYMQGNYDRARKFFQQALSVDNKLDEANANLGLLELMNGNVAEAQNYIASASGSPATAEAVGLLHLAQGNYALAEQDFGELASNNAALAQILNRNYTKAEQTLGKVENKDAMTDYLRAVLYARKGNKGVAGTFLRSAISKDSSLEAFAKRDLELTNVR